MPKNKTLKLPSPVGRPQLYKTPEELQAKIDEYFASGFRMVERRNNKGEVYHVPKVTITGLVIFLGFADRTSFYDYEKMPEFSYTIKRARSFIEREYEEQLDINPTGAIFALKNFNWSDKQQLESDVNMAIKIDYTTEDLEDESIGIAQD